MEENGLLYLIIPDAANFRPSKTLVQNFLFGHLHTYTPHTINLMLLKNGFKIVKWKSDDSLHVIASKIEDKYEYVGFADLKSGSSVNLLKIKLKLHIARHILFRIKRKLISLVKLK
jgi:hypothetical protein